ncbi:FtsX-like permease family protein [Jiangella asiatica]|uniref:FtsX-like permease family protein n=1 Tax=Jiangella asiatica TaxID=2530372 RepID=A0A4R5D683_9ACTN|nr:ABC transporter permease [Jiangella asiatica]TDE08896.1 FtsX-like permease family protein [Jiangella asiatica]
MRGVIVAGLRAHLPRLGLTGLVVVLSVGFTAATLMLTDSLDRARIDRLADTVAGVDLTVLAATGEYLDEAAATDVAGIDGVAAAAPRREVGVKTVDPDGRIDPLSSARLSAVPDDAELAGLALTEGRAPAADDEVVLDTRTAARAGVEPGETFAVAAMDSGAPAELTVVGLVEPPSPTRLDPELYATYGGVGRLAEPAGADRVDLRLEPGTDTGQVRAELAALDGADRVLSGGELAQLVADRSALTGGELRLPLLMLGAVSLLVAAFVIANIFRILIAARTRELALLRTVGATRRQVLRGLLAESVAIGIAGSVAGVGLGAVAALVTATVIDSGPGRAPLVVSPSSVVWSLVVGVLVTVGSAVPPARIATRVSPLAALHTVPDGADSRTVGRVRAGSGLLAMAAGALLLIAGAGPVSPDTGLVAVVVGAAVCFLGLLVLGPLVVPPLVRALGAGTARLAGAARSTAELATGNAVRNPRRVAATTAALLIGVTTVAGFVTVAESSRGSVDVVVDGQLPADLVVHWAGEGDVPAGAVRAIENLPETGAVAETAGGGLAVDVPDGDDGEAARAAILEATHDLQELSVESLVDRRTELNEDLDDAVNVVLGVLALALVIAFIGIANTLSLSVHERTREIGLLRALGLTRRQTRILLGVEAALMGAVAAVLGTAAGALFAWAAVLSVDELVFVVPWGLLALSAVVAVALGVLASLVPGRRAARTAPVTALAAE